MTIQEKLTYLFDRVNWRDSFLDAKANKILNEIEYDIEMEFAAQQLFGFQCALSGQSIQEMATAMGMKKEEWQKLKSDPGYELMNLSKNNIDALESHFNQ